jgi:hypothetical protein
MMSTSMDLVHDYDFHPDEPDVRLFRLPRADVLRLDAGAFVSEADFDGIVLRHYAFRDEWFKVNITFDRTGAIVESSPAPGVPAFALNCDIATPMALKDSAVYAVDLFADVLVRKDGVSHQVTDVEQLRQAAADGLLSPREAYRAQQGLDRLIRLIDGGRLLSFLEQACPFGPSRAAPALPVARVSLDDVPLLQPRQRPTWHAPQSSAGNDG